jgi:hypothetical protein
VLHLRDCVGEVDAVSAAAGLVETVCDGLNDRASMAMRFSPTKLGLEILAKDLRAETEVLDLPGSTSEPVARLKTERESIWLALNVLIFSTTTSMNAAIQYGCTEFELPQMPSQPRLVVAPR